MGWIVLALDATAKGIESRLHNMFNVRDASGSGDPSILDLEDLSSASRSTCGMYMPVAKAYCVLRKRHAGGCRSRK